MKYTLISTTSKHNIDYLELPHRNIFGNYSRNFLISSKENLLDFVRNYDNNIVILADCEKKQGISIYDELINQPLNVIDYKPNDLTMEAADIMILKYFKSKVAGKSIAIYGTGNIAFKLALRLSERNVNVYLYGRNTDKVKKCIETLKQITFDSTLIHFGDENSKVDSLISFVNGEQVIKQDFINNLNRNALCIDGGIGNFSVEFIQSALAKNYEVRRLDVRQSQEIMNGYINSRLHSQFDQIIGRDVIENYSVIAGGVMGKEGEVIVDKISEPSKVIGIANGIGGVKKDDTLTLKEIEKVFQVQKYIERSTDKK